MAELGMRHDAVEPWTAADHELDAVMDAVAWYQGADSRFVDAFEARLAAYLDMAFAVAVASDSGAASVLLGAMGVGPGDTVILSPAASKWLAFAVIHAGVEPTFVDFAAADLTLDPTAARAAATGRTKAVIASPLWGYPVDLSGLSKVARDAGIPLVVDLTQTIGARFEGRNLLRHADIGLLSLRERDRTISVGEGGAILFRDRQLAAKAKSYARFSDLDGVNLGINQKLSEPQAALASRRLEDLPRRLECQRAAAHVLEATLMAAGVETLAGDGRSGTFVVVAGDAPHATLRLDVSSLRLAMDAAPCLAFATPCPFARSAARRLRAVACHAHGGLA